MSMKAQTGVYWVNNLSKWGKMYLKYMEEELMAEYAMAWGNGTLQQVVEAKEQEIFAREHELTTQVTSRLSKQLREKEITYMQYLSETQLQYAAVEEMLIADYMPELPANQWLRDHRARQAMEGPFWMEGIDF